MELMSGRSIVKKVLHGCFVNVPNELKDLDFMNMSSNLINTKPFSSGVANCTPICEKNTQFTTYMKFLVDDSDENKTEALSFAKFIENYSKDGDSYYDDPVCSECYKIYSKMWEINLTVNQLYVVLLNNISQNEWVFVKKIFDEYFLNFTDFIRLKKVASVQQILGIVILKEKYNFPLEWAEIQVLNK